MDLHEHPESQHRALISIDSPEEYVHLIGSSPILVGSQALTRRVPKMLIDFDTPEYPVTIDLSRRDLGRIATTAMRLSQKHNDPSRLLLAKRITDFMADTVL